MATLTGIAGQTVPPAPASDSSAHAAGAQEVAVAIAVALRCNAIANVIAGQTVPPDSAAASEPSAHAARAQEVAVVQFAIAISQLPHRIAIANVKKIANVANSMLAM